MVGRFTLGNKNSPVRESPSFDVHTPPPSYRESGISPIILAETTTTTTEVVTTTTQTTTHFFSLPLWRKRGVPSPVSPRQTSFGLDVDEDGMIRPDASPAPLMLEKDLPPTPPSETDSAKGPKEAADAQGNRPSGRDIPIEANFTSQPFLLSDPRKSTFALAHASLGLGLPHVMPHASASSSPSEINTISFIPASTPPPQGSRLSAPNIRKAKSSQKFRPNSTLEEWPSVTDGVALDEGGRRRARGLSLGTSSFLNFGSNSVKGKGKEKEADETQSSPKTVSRRASFWSRKKQTPPSELSTLPARGTHALPLLSLPSVPPVSPFHMDLRASSSPPPPHQNLHTHSRGLSRSLSERRSVSRLEHPEFDKPIPDIHRGVPLSKPPDRTPRRPVTADSSVRSPGHSLNEPSPILTSTPPSNLPLHDQPIYHESQSTDSHSQTYRPRTHTNPPILHRLSLNIFSSSASPPSPPASPRFTNSEITSPAVSFRSSPRTSLNRPPVEIPKPQEDEESPEVYLNRLLTAVSKAEVAAILASSTDPFYVRALQAYIEQFDFLDDPLDVALRKLLMDVGLPRETQQIDRVMEAFARRYSQCNPNLFTSEDHPYILAFSLIMLHTDAFNKSNKRKMTKADYIKNTRLPGVSSDVLDCFYDNIVFAPFIFIEDPLDVNGQRGLLPEGASSRMLSSIGNPMANSGTNNGTTLLSKGGKVDPYYLIAHNLLSPLRVNVEAYMSLTNPYSYEGTAGPWDEEELQRAFAKASIIEVGAVDHTRPSPFFGLSVGGAPGPLGNLGPFPEILPATGEIWTLKVTKVGLLNRKDDILEGGKKASSRKWRPWSVILTGSQLLLFRDPSWATTLLVQSESSDGQIIFPQASIFKPDELLSVKDAIAVFDKSYTKHGNTLRLVMPDGRQFLLQASDEQELNQWISRINYASAFKSAGVRMRSLGMSGKDVQLTGVAAATSHLHDMQHQAHSAAPSVRNWDGDAPQDLMDMLSADLTTKKPPSNRRVTMMSGREDMDLDVPTAPEIDGADQFKATFDQVKAELAARHWAISDEDFSAPEGPSRVNSLDSALTSPISTSGWSEKSRLPSRSQIIMSKVHDLESKMSAAQSQLDSDLRYIRNIATLTPFQRSTRDRLQVAVQSIAKRIMQVRLDITKLICHRDVLSNDLAAEGRDWRRTKKIALRAATETLRSKRGDHVPRMTLSFHGEEFASPSPLSLSQKLDTPSSQRPESSTCESFHSAMDFGPDWPSATEDMASSSFLSASRLVDSPARSSSGSLGSFPFPDMDVGSISPVHGTQDSPGIASARSSHERFYTAQESPVEEAEDWNKTRCAQRVSLVRMPSDIRMSALFERHNHSRYERSDIVAASPSSP